MEGHTRKIGPMRHTSNDAKGGRYKDRDTRRKREKIEYERGI